MAALLIAGVVVVVLVLLYAADRVRKAKSRARLLHAMNDRLTVAAAQIDQEQDRRRAVARSSAELTSVMPAIKRPPLTLPGVPGHGPDPAEEDAAGARPPAAGEAAPDEPAGEPPAAEEPAAEEPAPEKPAAEPAAEEPAAAELAAEEPGALEPGPEEPAAEAGEGRADRPAENTLTLPGLELGEVPAPRLRLTGEGTLIMSAVPGPGRPRRCRAGCRGGTGSGTAGRRPRTAATVRL